MIDTKYDVHQLVQFLKENLSVQIDSDSDTNYEYSSKTVTVHLLLAGEVISSSTCSIPD